MPARPGLTQTRYGRKGSPPVALDLVTPTGLVAGTVALYLPYVAHTTNTVFVRVQQAVTGLVADNDIEDNASFPVADYLITFAAGRLTGASEIPRVASGADLETRHRVPGRPVGRRGRFLYDAKRQLNMLAIAYRNFYNPLGVQAVIR